MNLIFQIITTLALVIGIFLGEAVSTKAFGTFKKWWYYLIEIVLFVTIIVVVFSTIEIEIYAENISYIISFLIGFISIIFARGLISGLGFFSVHFKEKVLKKRNELDYIIGLKRALKRRNFKKEEIKKILNEVGFSDKRIEKVEKFFKE